jgi:hypothetical protein
MQNSNNVAFRELQKNNKITAILATTMVKLPNKGKPGLSFK